MFEDCRGKGEFPGTQCRMDGFNRERIYGAPPNAQYSYVPHSESKPYFDMANECVLADHMFQSQLDESFVAHQYVDRGAGALECQFAGRLGGAAVAGNRPTVRRSRADARSENAAPLFRLSDARRRAR